MTAELLVLYWICWMVGQVPGISVEYRGWRDDLASGGKND
jgi:hypothetical protein